MAGLRAFFSGPSQGIAFILIGVFCISINDVLIKTLSGAYPLHQMVFTRSFIGLIFSLAIVQLEGGWSILKTNQPWLHSLRGLLVVMANMTYFTALAVLPLADSVALFFVAPLFITLLSIPILGEKVGIRRLAAVLFGLLGVVVIVQPGNDIGANLPTRWVLMLPIFAAFSYAMMQVLTRKLGVSSKASAMAVYIQGMFILIGFLFFVFAGDGRYAVGETNESLIFLLRPWVWPTVQDWPLFLVLGVMSTIVGYALSQAYRVGNAATIAPYEYVAVPLAVLWGVLIFGTVPGVSTWIGIALIMASGIYVFIREGFRNKETASRRPIR